MIPPEIRPEAGGRAVGVVMVVGFRGGDDGKVD